MKHSHSITILLLILFLVTQFIGLFTLYKYIDPATDDFKELPIGERPVLNQETSYLPIILVIIIGTILLLLLIKHNLTWLWKLWFLVAVIFTLSISFSAFIPAAIAFAISLGLALWKIFKPNLWIQTFTELFIYGGLAVIFVPLFNLLSISILLVLISLYDMYAVWKSKHMIDLAKSQTKARIFAGLLIPYSKNKMMISNKRKGKRVSTKVRVAMLGGGDIGFPLLFAGVVLKQLGVWQSLLIPLFAGIGLGVLLYKSKEKKFYPAMPFISLGCFLGLAVVYVLM